MKKIILMATILFSCITLNVKAGSEYKNIYENYNNVGSELIISTTSQNATVEFDTTYEEFLEGLNCTAGSSHDGKTYCEISRSSDIRNVKFKKTGKYEFILNESRNCTNDGICEIEKSKFIYTITDKKIITVNNSKTVTMGIGSYDFGLKNLDKAVILIDHQYIDYDVIDFDLETICDITNDGSAVDTVLCKSSNPTSFNSLKFKTNAEYVIHVDYWVESDNTFTNYYTVYTFNIVDNTLDIQNPSTVGNVIETNGEDKNIELDNTGLIANIRDTELSSSIVLTENSKVEKIEINKAEFIKAKENNVSLKYEMKQSDKVQYEWNFLASDLKDDGFGNIDLKLKTEEVPEKLQKEFKTESAYLINFAHHGELPGKASIKVYVGDKYKPGDVLDFYYDDEENNKIESISKGLKVTDDGYVTVTISHCSNYILNLASSTSNNSQTSSMNTVLYGGIAIVSLLGIGYLLVNKKKNN